MLYARFLNFFGEITLCALEITDKILSSIDSDSLSSHVRTATSPSKTLQALLKAFYSFYPSKYFPLNFSPYLPNFFTSS